MAQKTLNGRLLTKSLESAIRKKIDLQLRNLGWNIDEESSNCNVFTERPKTEEQKKKLKGKKPDYVLYKSKTDKPIAIIETKRPDQNIKQALDQGINDYAKVLDIPIVFATDGTILETYHIKHGTELKKDEQSITELLSERELLKFVENAEIESPKEIQYTKKELIRIFGRANELLRKEGLREGIERFTEFANLLFLKLISEMEDERETCGEERILEKKYCWESFAGLDDERMLSYINDTILPRLVNRYNTSGEVFQTELKINNPRTLKEIVDNLSKLKLINLDSDIKGDAFEYFLKNSVTVGNDLGEYFTPRHIVKVMVKLVDPKFGETVYDPCCGTGGFLIEAFRHIRNKCKHTKANIRKLKNDSVFGRELTGTAKISKMNMILTGDGHTNIKQIDSLENPVKEKYDTVLTNFPFAQETDYSHLYGFDTKDANPIFLKHIIDALKRNGRAGVVTFQGVLYDNKSTYVKIRKYLLDNCNLEAVIKLHNFVFKPYAGANTSILIFSKGKPTKSVWFFNVENDGFEKTGSQRGRPPIEKNDLKLLMEIWNTKDDTENSWTVDIERIKKSNYILNAETYKPSSKKKGKFDLVPILEITNLIKDTVKPFDGTRKYLKTGNLKENSIENFDTVTYKKRPSRANLEVQNNDVIFAKMKDTNKFLLIDEETQNLIVSTGFIVLRSKDRDVLDPEFLKYMVSSKLFLENKNKLAHGSTQEAINEIHDLRKIKIPCPPIHIQRDIVNILKEHEKIIKNIEKTEKVILEVGISDSLFQSGEEKGLNAITLNCQYGTSKLSNAKESEGIPILRMNNITYSGQLDLNDLKYIKLDRNERNKYLLRPGDILFNRTNSKELVGKTTLFDKSGFDAVFASYLIRIKVDEKNVLPKYVSYYMNSRGIKEKLFRMARPSVNMSNINSKELLSIRIKIPSIDEQKKVVSLIDTKFETINNIRKLKQNEKDIMHTIINNLW